jgi:hypothetical protein
LAANCTHLDQIRNIRPSVVGLRELAKAIEHVRAVGGRETARRRLMRSDNEPAVPSPELESSPWFLLKAETRCLTPSRKTL